MYSGITVLSGPTVETVISRPEMLSYKVPLPLSVHPCQVDRALALDKPDLLRHRALYAIIVGT